jgi:Protein of unknown function (DUF2849)
MTSPLEQKIKITGPVVVTANRVGDGAVVYFDAGGGWTTDLGHASVTSEAATARELVRAATADDLHAVGPYVAPVKLTRDGAPQPGNLRELIRRYGPTIDLPATFGSGSTVPKVPAVIGSEYRVSRRDHARA